MSFRLLGSGRVAVVLAASSLASSHSSCSSSSSSSSFSTASSSAASSSYSPPLSLSSSSSREETIKKIKALHPELDAIYERHYKEHCIPGLLYGVILDGELVLHGSLGSVSASSHSRGIERPSKDTSMFRIASMSKSFTAMAIVQLRDKGLLRLSDPVSKYVPEMKRIAPLSADSPEITIGHLLTMQAGFPQDDPWGDRLLDITNGELRELLVSGLHLSNPTGTGYEYSNLGYAILGLVITNISGMPYQEYITKNIFQPLGMNATVFEYDEAGSNLVQGYRWEDKSWKKEPLLHDGAFGAMGGIITTLSDFTKFVSLHQNAWPPSSLANSQLASSERNIISRSSLREMHFPWCAGGMFVDKSTVQQCGITLNKMKDASDCPLVGVREEAYGYGLKSCQDLSGVRWIRHAGGLPGFSSEWRFLPEHGLGIVVFGNRTYSSNSDANHAAMTLLLRENAVTRRPQISPVLHHRSRQLLKCLQRDFDETLCEEIFACNFFLDKPQRLWLQDTESIRGILKNPESVGELMPQNDLRGAFIVRGRCGRSIKVFFTMTPQNQPQIQELKLSFVQESQA